jgi:DNA-binding MarR family transcriptional regulator
MTMPRQPARGDTYSARDSIDALLASWAERRPDFDFSPVAVISRLARVRAHIDSELDVVFQAYGLGQSDFEALVTLARIGEEHGVSQRRLADELGLTASTVSLRIDRLVEQGLVRRTADPGSRRGVLIALNESGREMFERITPAHLANERRLLAGLSEGEQQVLADLLRKLLVEFEGSRSTSDAGRIGLVVAPAHVTISMRAAVGLPPDAGLLVRFVEAESPAARAGIRVGDVLIKAGQHELRSSASLYGAVREAAGGRLALTLLRGTRATGVELTLDSDGAVGQSVRAREQRGQPEHVL